MKEPTPKTQIERVAAYLLADAFVVCGECNAVITWQTADLEKRGASVRVRWMCRNCRKTYQRERKVK